MCWLLARDEHGLSISAEQAKERGESCKGDAERLRTPVCKALVQFMKMRHFSKEELAKYNGKNGSLTYIAYNGKVYDLSGSLVWRNGNHKFAHNAGQDLTDSLRQAPHSEIKLKRFPVVGRVRED